MWIGFEVENKSIAFCVKSITTFISINLFLCLQITSYLRPHVTTMDHTHHHNSEQAPPDHMDHSKMDHASPDAFNIVDASDHGDHGDHASSDHTGHMGHSMKMYFHGGFEEVILFDPWRIDGIGGLIGSMFGCFILAVFYEGLKFCRENIVRRSFKESQGRNEGLNSSSRGQLQQQADGLAQVRTVENSMWSWVHLSLTFLHMVQLTVAYFLMLVFMTYNSWLCASVVLGATLGHFLFGWRKTVIFHEADCCH